MATGLGPEAVAIDADGELVTRLADGRLIVFGQGGEAGGLDAQRPPPIGAGVTIRRFEPRLLRA